MQLKYKFSRQMQNFGEQHPGFRYWHDVMNRRVRVYENKSDEYVDRYTICISRQDHGALIWDIYTMSAIPTLGSGVNLYSHSQRAAYIPTTDEARRHVVDLPEGIIAAIENRMEY